MPEADGAAAREAAREAGEAGRDPATFGLQARLSLRQGDPDLWREYYAWYRDNGFTHFCVSTIWSGATTLDEHFALLQRFCDEVGVLQ